MKKLQMIVQLESHLEKRGRSLCLRKHNLLQNLEGSTGNLSPLTEFPYCQKSCWSRAGVKNDKLLWLSITPLASVPCLCNGATISSAYDPHRLQCNGIHFFSKLLKKGISKIECTTKNILSKPENAELKLIANFHKIATFFFFFQRMHLMWKHGRY